MTAAVTHHVSLNALAILGIELAESEIEQVGHRRTIRRLDARRAGFGSE